MKEEEKTSVVFPAAKFRQNQTPVIEMCYKRVVNKKNKKEDDSNQGGLKDVTQRNPREECMQCRQCCTNKLSSLRG